VASRIQHLGGAFLLWFLFNILFYNPFFTSNFFMGLILAITGGAFPDIIEPPSNPRHRSIIHLLGAIALLIPFADRFVFETLDFLINSFLIGYGSHFLMDYTFSYNEWQGR
jgi:TRAP-type mannitol/chloroaromatic compound transport system permease small subunit